jgi:hypothetical protein
MYVHFWVVATASLFVALGLFYRLSIVVVCLGYTYIMLLEQALFFNHVYLVCLLALLLAFLPANGAFSLDALIWSSRRRETVEAWVLWLLRFQIGVVYFFAGVAKIHPDWLHGATIRLMFGQRADLPDQPALASLFQYDSIVLLFSWGGVVFDLLVVPLLLWKRTRIVALVAAAGFHCFNAVMLNIDIL